MTTPQQDRHYWIDMLERVARPVLAGLAARRLKASMPIEVAHPRSRAHVSHLEALGRTLAGLAPWLEADGLDAAEAARRDEMKTLAQAALQAAIDPKSPDWLDFGIDRQCLVDAAFLGHAVLRAPGALWHELDATTQANLVTAMQATRVFVPNPNNWLLFMAMVETFLQVATGQADLVRIDYALRQHEQWYLGDGTYGDGDHFHWDYYNSFVIQPMLLDIVRAMADQRPEWAALVPRLQSRARRYAQVQERLIAPDGSFPPLGRSITYRAGAFQLLAQMVDDIPLPPGAVRAALTAVIRRTLEAPGTFDADGWLRLGLSGHQPSLAEPYISTGSLYLCTCAFLPLGLSPAHAFWQDEAQPWTSQRIWNGDDMPADKAADGIMKSDYEA